MGFDIRRALVLVSAISCAVLSRETAHAQSAEDRATARVLVAEAETKLQANDLPGAFDLFRRAYGLIPAPTLRLEMARIKVKQGDLVEAQDLYMDIARTKQQPDEPSQWAAARATAAAEGAALSQRIPTVVLRVQGVAPAEAKVFMDGVEVPTVALGVPRAVNPGLRTVRATREGFEPFEKRLNATEGARQQVDVTLIPDVLAEYGLDPSSHAAARIPLKAVRDSEARNDQDASLQHLAAVDAMVQAPTIKLAIAERLVRRQRLIEAEQALLQAAQIPAGPQEPAVWGKARQSARETLPAVQARIPILSLVLPLDVARRLPVVTLDGAALRLSAGRTDLRLNPGTHVVRVAFDGTAPVEIPVALSESQNETANITFNQPQKSQGPSERDAGASSDDGRGPWATLSFVGAGLFAGTGAVLGIMAKSKTDDVKKDCVDNTCPKSRQADADAAGTLADLSTAAFVLAGASLTAGILVLSSDSSDSTAASRGRIDLAVGPAALHVRGSF